MMCTALLEKRNEEERKEKKKAIQVTKQAEVEAKEAMKKQVSGNIHIRAQM